MSAFHPIIVDCGTFGPKTVLARIVSEGKPPTADLASRYRRLRRDWQKLWPVVLEALRSRVDPSETGMTVDAILTDPSTTYVLEVFEPTVIESANWSFTVTRVFRNRKLTAPLAFADSSFEGGQAVVSQK